MENTFDLDGAGPRACGPRFTGGGNIAK